MRPIACTILRWTMFFDVGYKLWYRAVEHTGGNSHNDTRLRRPHILTEIPLRQPTRIWEQGRAIIIYNVCNISGHASSSYTNYDTFVMLGDVHFILYTLPDDGHNSTGISI